MITALSYVEIDSADEIDSAELDLAHAKQFLTHDWKDEDAPACGKPLGPMNFARFHEWLDSNFGQVEAGGEQTLIIKFGCGLPGANILFDQYLGPLARHEQKFCVYLLS